jgi:hypothetical protein
MVEHGPQDTRWTPVGAMGTMRLTPAPRLGEAQNAANGFHRRFSRGPINAWLSHPASGLPQDLVLSWPEPQAFDHVTLTFDNLPPSRHENPWESGRRVLDRCVRSYALSVWEGGSWREILREDDNYHRFRTHTFAPIVTDKLRLTIVSTHGEGWGARVYQVSVYHKGD